MKNLSTFLLIGVALWSDYSLYAQTPIITNGSFETGDFTGWQTTVGIVPGSPSVRMGGPQDVNGTTTTVLNPAGGAFQAFIQSTGGASMDQGVDAVTLAAFVGLAGPLPDSSVVGGVPLNGTAIKQTFGGNFLGGGKLSFSYAYQSREMVGSGLDETGYVLNGAFHILVDSNTPGVTAYTPANGIFESFLGYQSTTVNIAAGTNTLSFLSYNTLTTLSSTALLVDNVVVVPLFSTVGGLTPNQSAVATYIDNHDLSNDPNFANVITALGNATTITQLGDDLDQLTPQSLQVFRRIAFDNSTFNTLDVNNHLANLRDGLTGFDSSQLTVSDPSMTSGGSRIKGRLRDPKDMDAKSMQDSKEMDSAPYSDKWSTFIVGNVILADLSHDQDLAHQNYTTGGVMLGTDYRFDDHFTVGALLGYNHTDADLDHIGSKATVDGYSPGVYASYVDGGWYGNALFNYTYNSYTDDRNVQLGTLTGSNHGAAQGNQYTGSLLGGYEFHHGELKYGPFASLQYVNLGINSFTEDGPTALDIHSQSDDSFRTQLGFDVRYATHIGATTLIPHFSASWQHECLDNNNGITSDFSNVGGGSFTVQTTEVGRDAAVIDAGLDAGICKDVTLFLDYSTEAGEDHYFGQSVSAGVRLGF